MKVIQVEKCIQLNDAVCLQSDGAGTNTKKHIIELSPEFMDTFNVNAGGTSNNH
jgi:hypothetical protein